MMNIIEKSKNDKGNAIMVLGIMLIVVVLAVGAMLLDITKAFQMKAAYNDAAQKAAQAAIMHTNQQGYLTANSIGAAIIVYENIARPATIKDGYMSFCPDPKKENPEKERIVEITVTAMKENFIPGDSYTIKSNRIKKSDSDIYDLNEIINEITWRELGFGNQNSEKRKNFEAQKYTGIEIELYESTPNIILPNTSVIAGINDGEKTYKCQNLGVRAGASQYIGIENKYD